MNLDNPIRSLIRKTRLDTTIGYYIKPLKIQPLEDGFKNRLIEYNLQLLIFYTIFMYTIA